MERYGDDDDDDDDGYQVVGMWYFMSLKKYNFRDAVSNHDHYNHHHHHRHHYYHESPREPCT